MYSYHGFWFRYHICVYMISHLYSRFAFTSELSHFIIFLFLIVAFSFPPREVPLAFVIMLVWWHWILFCFCLSVKLLISPSNLNKSLAEQSILACRLFPFIFKCIMPLSSVCKVSTENPADNFMEIAYMLFVAFHLLVLMFFLSL